MATACDLKDLQKLVQPYEHEQVRRILQADLRSESERGLTDYGYKHNDASTECVQEGDQLIVRFRRSINEHESEKREQRFDADLYDEAAALAYEWQREAAAINAAAREHMLFKQKVKRLREELSARRSAHHLPLQGRYQLKVSGDCGVVVFPVNDPNQKQISVSLQTWADGQSETLHKRVFACEAECWSDIVGYAAQLEERANELREEAYDRAYASKNVEQIAADQQVYRDEDVQGALDAVRLAMTRADEDARLLSS